LDIETGGMAINIKETFQVDAPLEAVWRFVIDPHQVVTCLPGAELQEVVDDHTFLGRVKVKVGAITTSYKGRITFDEVDETGRAIRMVAEGRDAGGGTAKGTMTGRLRSLSPRQTEVVAEASVDLTGRIMQVGRGMIQGVSHQLFLQFVASTKERLEAPQQASPGQASAPIAPVEVKPIRAIPLLLRALMTAIAQFFRRVFGRRAP
jgi:carbon monoxide dehydrogenase subunit G